SRRLVGAAGRQQRHEHQLDMGALVVGHGRFLPTFFTKLSLGKDEPQLYAGGDMTTVPLLLFTLFLVAAGFSVLCSQRYLAARAVLRALGPEVAAMRWQAAALAAEITRRHRAGEAFDADFFRTWRLSEPQVFPAVGGDLGLLSYDAIDRIGYFHAQLAAGRERLALAAAEGGFQPSPYRMLSVLVRAFNHVDPWVKPYLS